MDADDQIKKFGDFLERFYKSDLMENIRKGKESIALDFSELIKFDPELADYLLEYPEEAIKSAEIAIDNFDIEGKKKKFHVRFKNFSASQQIMIRNIRSVNLNKFYQTVGVIRQKSDVRPQVTSVRFECPSCGTVISVLQTDKKFKEPMKCGCGRKGKFRELSKELIDAQGIVLEEDPGDLEGGEQPKRINVLMKDDLVSPMTERHTNPGARVKMTGIVKEIPLLGRDGGKLTRFDIIFECNYVEAVQEDFYEINISEEEEAKIKEIAKDPNSSRKLVEAIAPSIYGYEKVKEALLIQLVGGVKKVRSDGMTTRGDMHILLIGDPGSGKSQLLKRISKVAPKARYVSGKGVSGAGLTASVVKDEFLNGWALEAGALPLANKGMCMIDEMDKMSVEDRSAMHEALEQQCFHYDTLFQFADGSEQKIGDYVESIFRSHPEKIIDGKECLIIKLDRFDREMLTTDWGKIFKTKIDRVSKHIAKDKFIEITISNGRKIKVTEEHPVFCIEDARIVEKRADRISEKDWIPIPLNLPIEGEAQYFKSDEESIFNARSVQHISIPVHNDRDFYKIIGYLLAEGSKETNRDKLIGINFTNKDPYILKDFRKSMKSFFNIEPYAQPRIDNHDIRYMLRYTSRELAEFLKSEVPEILNTSAYKSIPILCMKGRKDDIACMLSCMFEGDGHVSKKERTIRIGYASNSRLMCEQVQDLLLRFSIRSNLTSHKGSYKVSITGYDNIFRFKGSIGFISDKKNKIIEEYLKDKQGIRSIKSIIPNCQHRIVCLLEKYSIKKVGKNTLATMKHDYLKRGKSVSRNHLQKIVIEIEKRMMSEDRIIIEDLRKMAFGDIGFERVKEVKFIENDDQIWSYDITIEPNHTFISQAQILHNTISISKANIQATLRAETTVLAAANPKFGRFDPYDIIANQINLPPALINRFDLIFTIKDMPDYEKDELMAQHILGLHQNPDVGEKEIPTELLKKYVSYARRTAPVLTEAAVEEIKKYYVDMRNKDNEGAGIKSVPISARQLEGLVRLSEGIAKLRLSDKVSRKDAKRAIELMHYCLSQIGVDPKTGKIDIDRIATGISASQRSSIMSVKEIIHELEAKIGKTIPIEDILKEASERGIDGESVDEAIEKLKRSGDIFEPKRGFVAKI